jgi:hypothetical protein
MLQVGIPLLSSSVLPIQHIWGRSLNYKHNELVCLTYDHGHNINVHLSYTGR